MTINDNFKKQLTPRQLKIIALLLSAKNQEDALRQSKLSRQTLTRWMKDPQFQNELKRRSDELIDQAFEVLKRKMAAAANALIGLLTSKNEAIRLRAANDIMGHVLRMRELNELEARVTALEQTAIPNRS